MSQENDMKKKKDFHFSDEFFGELTVNTFSNSARSLL